MKITLSGESGSGKTTIGKALAKRLGYNFYDIGDVRRQMAKDRGMTIEEFNKLGEKESFTDTEADEYAKKIGDSEDNFVMQGRVAYYFIPDSIKVYLTVSHEVAAKRVFYDTARDRTVQQHTDSISEQKKILMGTDTSNIIRYRKYYGIYDFTDRKNYDFILDTTNEHDVEKNVDKIIDYLKQKQLLVEKIL